MSNVVRANVPYVADAEVPVNRESAFRLIQQLLAMTDLTPAHHREQLTVGLWKWTEALGVRPHRKYNLPLCSGGVRGAVAPVKINHEHVWTRDWIIKRMLVRAEWPTDELRGLLERYGVGCVVSVEEHARLGSVRGEGWQRYINAKVGVWDVERQAEFQLVGDSDPEAVSELVEEDDEHDETAAAETLMTAEQAIVRFTGARARLLTRLVQAVSFAGTVAVVGRSRTPGQVGKYVRIHDTAIGEPTRAAAFVNWNGAVEVCLERADVPSDLFDRAEVSERKDRLYRIRCRVSDDASRETAEDLVLIALEKLREGYEV